MGMVVVGEMVSVMLLDESLFLGLFYIKEIDIFHATLCTVH